MLRMTPLKLGENSGSQMKSASLSQEYLLSSLHAVTEMRRKSRMFLNLIVDIFVFVLIIRIGCRQ